jgi:hypothetical protein
MRSITLFAIFSAFLACSGDKDPATDPAATPCKIKTIVTENVNSPTERLTITFNYDKSGSLFSVVFDDPAHPPIYTVAITLDASKNIVQMDYDGPNSTFAPVHYKKAVIGYNPLGKVVSADLTSFAHPFPSIKTIYTYNGSQQLVQVIDKIYNTAAGNTYTDYSTVLLKYTDDSTNPTSIARCVTPCTSPVYEPVNYATGTFTNPTGLLTFIASGGSTSSFLMQSFTMTKSLSAFVGVSNIEYVTDSNNLLTKITYRSGSTTVSVNTLTYQCN